MNQDVAGSGAPGVPNQETGGSASSTPDEPVLMRLPIQAPKPPPLSIGAFIGILHLLIGVLGAGIIGAYALYSIYQGGVQSSLRELEGIAYVTENALEGPVQAYQRGEVNASEIEAILRHYMQARPNVDFSLVMPDGSPLLTNSNPCAPVEQGLDAPEVREALNNAIGHDIRECSLGLQTIYVAVAVNQPATTESMDQNVTGVLVLSVPLNDMLGPTYRTMRWMGVVALLIVAVTVLEGWLGSVYISRPLARLSKVAERFSRGDLTARAEINGPTEVIHLARTFNAMAGYVQNSLETMRSFVANASHELRTPLTGIKLQVGALTGGAIDDLDLAGRFLSQIDGEINRLTTMVNDMLDLTQIESGARVVRQRVDLLDLLREVRAFWDTRSRQVGLMLQLITEDRVPPVLGDPYQLRQLLDNLLDNAVKYTQPGGRIDIALSRAWTGERWMARIEVRDTGVGIDPAQLPHIFDRFFRVDRKREGGSRVEGSGIGLAIARSIVLAHGGHIGVESTPGKGSTFWVELPI